MRALPGALTLGAFAFVLYGIYDGIVGVACNDVLTSPCIFVYRARSTAFLTLGTLLLINAFDCRDQRRYVWQLPLFRNLALVLAFVLCFGSLAALVYIPYVNTVLLQQAPITWEWGVVGVCAVVYELLVQVYKFVKNRVSPSVFVRDETPRPSLDVESPTPSSA